MHYVIFQAQCESGQGVLSVCSRKVEEAVKELICLLRHAALLPTVLPSDSEEIVKSKNGR